MAGITYAQAEAKLAIWLEADEKVASGQSYSIAGRSLTRADASEIRSNIEFWDRQCKRLVDGRSGPKVRGITPV